MIEWMLRLILLICTFSFIYADESKEPTVPRNTAELFREIKDIYHPTIEDYKRIQNYLTYGERNEIRLLQDANYEYVARAFKIIGDTPEEMPRSEVIPVNCKEDEKENCILIYASFNRNYPKSLERLVNYIKNSDFKGHVLYRCGGWPNVEGGSLLLAHVPYAFKPSYFKEAERLGYKRIFWLDTALLPLVNLNFIFDSISRKGYFVMGNTHMLGPYINEKVPAVFGITREATYQIPSCSAGLFGVDLTNPKGKEILDRWYNAACSEGAFFSSRPEQNALSIILYQMGIQDFVPITQLPHSKVEIKSDSLFLLDRGFAHWGK